MHVSLVCVVLDVCTALKLSASIHPLHKGINVPLSEYIGCVFTCCSWLSSLACAHTTHARTYTQYTRTRTHISPPPPSLCLRYHPLVSPGSQYCAFLLAHTILTSSYHCAHNRTFLVTYPPTNCHSCLCVCVAHTIVLFLCKLHMPAAQSQCLRSHCRRRCKRSGC